MLFKVHEHVQCLQTTKSCAKLKDFTVFMHFMVQSRLLCTQYIGSLIVTCIQTFYGQISLVFSTLVAITSLAIIHSMLIHRSPYLPFLTKHIYFNCFYLILYECSAVLPSVRLLE